MNMNASMPVISVYKINVVVLFKGVVLFEDALKFNKNKDIKSLIATVVLWCSTI